MGPGPPGGPGGPGGAGGAGCAGGPGGPGGSHGASATAVRSRRDNSSVPSPPNGSMGDPFPNFLENGTFQQRFRVYTAISKMGGGWLLRMTWPMAIGDGYVDDPMT